MTSEKEPVDAAPDADPGEGGRRTFGESLGRAASKAASTPFFSIRDHAGIKTRFTKSIYVPLSEIAEMFRTLVGNTRTAIKEEPPLVEFESLYADVSNEQLAKWISTAILSWWIASGTCLLASGFLAYGAAHGQTLAGFNTVTSGICLMIYGSANGLRCARDIEIMRTRAPLTLRQFFGRITELWCPLPQDSKVGQAVRSSLPLAWVGVLLGTLVLVLVK